MASDTGSSVRRPHGFVAVLPYLLDVIIPLVSFYILTGLGMRPFWALVIGGGITAVIAIVNTFRRGRLDKLGLLVILEVALSITLDLTVQSARLTLARGSLYILVGGVWFLVTTFTDRPVTLEVTKGFAARKGGRRGIDAFEWLAENSTPFLRVQRRLSVVWSVLFLAYAVMRVVVIYSVDISQAVWLNEVPGAIAFLIGIAVSARAGKKLEVMVNDQMKEAAGQTPDPVPGGGPAR